MNWSTEYINITPEKIKTVIHLHEERLVLKYFEEYQYIDKAIAREKQIKGWTRKKKEALINGDISVLKKLSNHNKRPEQ